MERSAIPRATLGRLPDYLEFLKGLSPEKTPCISAPAIARQLGLGEVQVRKDLGFVGGQGRPRIGFSTADLIRRLEESLGGQLSHRRRAGRHGKAGQGAAGLCRL